MTPFEKENNLTYDELQEKFPNCKDDMRMTYSGMGGVLAYTDYLFRVTVDPMAKWTTEAQYLQDLFAPEDDRESRITAIMSELRGGAVQFPIFCLDGCLMEGHHRLVAFHRLGRKTLPVVDIDWDAMDTASEGSERTKNDTV